jgi:hypothetical protein
MDAYCERNWKQEKGNAEEVTLIEHHAVQKATYLYVRNFEGKRETCSFMGREKHYPALLHLRTNFCQFENGNQFILKTTRISNLDGLTFERPRISDVYS